MRKRSSALWTRRTSVAVIVVAGCLSASLVGAQPAPHDVEFDLDPDGVCVNGWESSAWCSGSADRALEVRAQTHRLRLIRSRRSLVAFSIFGALSLISAGIGIAKANSDTSGDAGGGLVAKFTAIGLGLIAAPGFIISSALLIAQHAKLRRIERTRSAQFQLSPTGASVLIRF